jgi:hypothetical protein
MFAIARRAPDVMEQLGHTDARLTLRVYARAMRQSAVERDRLKALVEGADWAPTGTSADSASHATAPSQSPAKKNPGMSRGSSMGTAGFEPATSRV